MRKRVISLCLSVIIIFILVMSPIYNNAYIVSAASDKTKIKSTVNNYFNAAKKYDVKKMNKYVKNINTSELEDISSYSSLRNYIKTSNESLEYSIKKINISKNTASVIIKCKYLDSSSIYKYAFRNILLFAFLNADKNYSDKTLTKKINSLFKKHLNYAKSVKSAKYKTKTFKINLLKEKWTWRIETVNYDLANSITANYLKALNDMNLN